MRIIIILKQLKRKYQIEIISVVFLLLASISYGQEKLYPNTFPLAEVILLDGPFKQARDLNIEVLLKYDVDRLLAPYLIEASLKSKAPLFPNWAGMDGHVGGHYLSALAIHYAATGNSDCLKRMEYMISELKTCQDTNAVRHSSWGIGYIGGVPNSAEVWSTLKTGDFTVFWKAWVPWYNIHKMFAGLRDAWLYTGNEIAKSMFLKFCNWGINITSALTDDQMQMVLGTEYGGMNEIYADAYQITSEEKYLAAAKRFSHKILFDAMAAGNDILDNMHANTQVPKAIGFQRIGELTNDEKYVNAGLFFWETVTENRSLAFGGNSRKEHFPSKKACSDYLSDIEGPESCNTNNMLKLTQNLFRINPLAKYADFYERALYNHILSTQHPEHGGYVYFTPARPCHYRVYSAPNKAMWCCVGTGMENHGKYNEFIYTHQNDTLFLNLFIASELNWKKKGLKIRQETKFPYEEKTRMIVTGGSSQFKLMVRYPFWIKDGALKMIVNGDTLSFSAQPSSYVAVDRLWANGDTVDIVLPMQNRIEKLINVPNYIAFMHGPIMLGAKTGTQDLAGLIAGEGRWEHIAHGKRLPIDKVPIIIESNFSQIADKLEPINGKPLCFKLNKLNMINPLDLILEPFYKIHDARYIIYWMAFSNSEYQTYLDSLAKSEEEKLILDKRTIDFVAPGEQQPEADHAIQSSNSNTGNHLDEFWRDAKDGGYFSYKLNTHGETNLILMLRYWGYEWGSRKFDIFIDDDKLISEDNTGRWYTSKFINVNYKIPDSMVKGKDYIRVKFQAAPGSTAGAMYYIRLLKQKI